MDHTHIVTANDLDRYSDTRDSEAVIPELIYLLVKQSVPPPHVCRIPYGDTVNQSGWDGIVEIEESFLEFVPKGKSYWEIGTGRDPQKKATEDFKKRTETVTELGVITTPSEHWELILSQGDNSDPPACEVIHIRPRQCLQSLTNIV